MNTYGHDQMIGMEARVARWAEQGPWIFFDGSCGFCARGREVLGPGLERRGFRLAPLSSEAGRFAARDGVDEMKVMTREGKVIGGAEAIAYVGGFVWWMRPLGWAWAVRPLRPVWRWLYRRVAANRRCLDGVCGMPAAREAKWDFDRWF